MQSENLSRSLFYRIFFTRTGVHFAWKCSSGQLFVQKCPRVPGRKIIDLTKTQKATTLIKLCCARIECIKVEADALPRAGLHLGMRQQLATDAPTPKTLIDPKMTDIAPSPMGDTVEAANERVAVISENRKRRLAPRAKARRNLGAQSC
jgi:hypothetical protein